jgi:uncharacterized RDD family membrane protein YckC
MNEDDANPYAAPAESSEPPIPEVPDSTGDVLAGRGLRFLSAMIDGILPAAIIVPIQFGTGFYQRTLSQQVTFTEQLAMALVGMAAFLICHGYLLITRGQSIGKYLLGLQIVDYATGQLLPPMRVYVYRYLWSLPITITALLIPGTTDDTIFAYLLMIDPLFIFGEERRCLHDLIAGSKVVKYKANR